LTLAPCRCRNLERCLSCEIAAMRRRHLVRRLVTAGHRAGYALEEAQRRYPDEHQKRPPYYPRRAA